MKFRNGRGISPPSFMIIPMIDIIFFLLVFFMMNSLQTTTQRALAVQLPQAARAEVPSQLPVIISVDAAGRIALDGQFVSLEGAAAQLQAQAAANPQLAVILQADKSTSHGQVVAVMDMLKGAGVKKLGIAAEKKAR
ncbi:ExbD/TolR family protein [Sporomusa termitida]|uniref:Biopolymer transport protein ExbD n=1 Tax=Sporomusa termitida TaxID=2377 RepID=A0A517DZA7_9FIRM|nr:biopolymer transporter ExbD [Sporomusa termitida]QDR82695.1 Biopolymer transport protein ExbD [Sporomusa termitida]